MSRMIEFKKISEFIYGCNENNNDIFYIDSNNMSFNVKEFYEKIYKGQKDFEIKLQKDIDENDKIGMRIYNTIYELITLITNNLSKIERGTTDE